MGGRVSDVAGNLNGTTLSGDGGFPNAALIIVASGNVFGTTSPRGQSRQSTFFKVAS